MRLFANQIFWKVSIALYTLLTFIVSSIKKIDLGIIRIEKTDWLLHGIEFGILAYLVIRYFISSSRDVKWFTIMMVTVIYCAVIGGLNEILQSQIPGRTPSITDEIANIIGAIFVIVIYRLRNKIRKIK